MSDTPAAAPAKKPRQYASEARGSRTRLQGKVVSTKMSKTIVIEIPRVVKHAKYKKYVRLHGKVYAHDEKGEAKMNDIVMVHECRPYSKMKKYRLVQIVRKAAGN